MTILERPAEPVRTTRKRLPEVRPRGLSRPSVWLLAAAWVVLLPLAVAIEPVPAHPDAQQPWWGVILMLGLLASITMMGVGLRQRRRWGAIASLVAASSFVTGTFLCPATGHHEFGFWWFGELGAGLALVAVSARVLRRDRN